MRYRLMHISDLHAGPPFNEQIARQVAHYAHTYKPDLLVISGDFVQRADFIAQWHTARAFLETLPEPRLVVPGNHDVPLFNPFNRIFFSLRRYKRYISPNLNQVFERPGLVVAGANTAHGLTFDGGRLSKRQADILTRILGRYSDRDYCKVVVWHHPVINPPGLTKRREMARTLEAVRLLDRCGVELLLCGHIHVSYVGSTLDVVGSLGQGTIICQSGTTTSKRGYGREHGKNSFNLIEIDERVIRISHHLYLNDGESFVPVAEHTFPRRTGGPYRLPKDEQAVKTL